MSLGLLLYVLSYRPYDLMLDNYIELANETTILAVLCMLLPYLHMPSLHATTRYDIGFAIVVVILLNVLANFVYFMWCSFAKVFRTAKKPVIEVAQKVAQQLGIIQGPAQKHPLESGNEGESAK